MHHLHYGQGHTGGCHQKKVSNWMRCWPCQSKKAKGPQEFFLGLLILPLTSHHVRLQVPLAEFCLTVIIASSLGGGYGCHNIQVQLQEQTFVRNSVRCL